MPPCSSILRLRAGAGSPAVGLTRIVALASALATGSVPASAIPSAPEGAIESGAPAFVVLGPEALGLNSAPVDFKLMPDQRILVASQRELAFGDGVRWQTFRAGETDQPIYSSVAVDADGAIYTGTEGGIARVALDEGERFTLQHALHLPEIPATEDAILVSVATLPDDWYWYGGDGAIVSWHPGREPRRLADLGAIERFFTLDGVDFISDESSGALFRINAEGEVEPVLASDVLVSEVVTCAVPFGPGRLLVGTGASGLKLFDGKAFTPFGTAGLPGVGMRITDLCAAGDGYFAASIDTLGIVFFDRSGRVVQVLERSLDHRLARVRRLLYSPSGVLWALLNDGVACVEFPSPLSNFDPLLPSGLKFAQPVRHAGRLWVLADGRALRGVYDASERLVQFVDDTPAGRYLFTLSEVDGHLFACNESGIYILGENGWELALPGIVNARVGVARGSEGEVYYVARGEYGVIRDTGQGHVATRFPAPDLGDSYGVAIDADGIGWLELGNSRAGRFDPAGGRPVLTTYGTADGIDSTGWVEIYVLNGIARLHVQNRVYRFDEPRKRFAPDNELLAELPQLATTVGRPVTDSAGRLWHTVEGATRVVDRSPLGRGREIEVRSAGFAPTHYTAEENGVVWMFVRGRLARMDPRIPEPPPESPRALITSVQFSASSREIFAPAGALGRLDFSDNSLAFHFAAPASPFGTPVTFEVLLEGAGDKWISTGAVGMAAFKRLKEGAYVFRVRPVRGTVHGDEAQVPFIVAPPWYRSTAAWVAYVCSALALLGFAMWLSAFLQRRENERLEHLVAKRTAELSASNERLGLQIEETTRKSAALAASEERYRELNADLEDRVHKRTAELEVAHRQLVAASRKAGMAEVATGVLHNVGNVLNSVNVSATVVRDTLRTSEVASLGRVAGLLRERNGDAGSFIANDPKGRLLPGFIVQLADQITREHAVIRTENDQLVRNIDHIKGIVAMQQGYATVSGVLEEVDLGDLVLDALNMQADSMSRHGIRVVREFDSVPPVIADKHKILQVLVNLVQNAKQAVRDSGRDDGLIEVRLRKAGGTTAWISVSDNGVGIPTENLVRIFSHGFTTRSNGHGFGLHSGSLAAREMGGSLKAESPGPGLGATFTLEIPLTAAKAAPAK